MINISIRTVDKTLYKGEIDLVTLPGADGVFTLLPKHIALISTLKKGEIVLGKDKMHTFSISKGVVNFNDDVCTVLVEE